MIPFLRRLGRRLGTRLPFLRQSKLGIGRLLSRVSPIEQIVLDGDIRIELDLRVPQFRFYFFFEDHHQTVESVLIQRLLSAQDTFVDVGAHIGYFTLIAAKHAGQVIAFEPGPETFARLQRNLQLNPALASRVTTYPYALSSQTGMSTMHYAPSDPGASSLLPVEFTTTQAVSVQVETLDHMLTDHHPRFIKIDVEGAELDVLQGGRAVLERDRPVLLCELFEPWQNRFGRTCQDISSYLEQLGYRGFLVDLKPSSPGGIEAVPITGPIPDRERIYNGLFSPQEDTPAILERISSHNPG